MRQDSDPYSDFVDAEYFEYIACLSGRLVDLAQEIVCVCVCAVLNMCGLPSQLLCNELL